MLTLLFEEQKYLRQLPQLYGRGRINLNSIQFTKNHSMKNKKRIRLKQKPEINTYHTLQMKQKCI